jgi:hypothetical protein
MTLNDLDMHRILTDIAFDIDIGDPATVSASLKERAKLLLAKHKAEQIRHSVVITGIN